MPRFSVIVPIYNVEMYVIQCLSSIKEQTFRDFEVILVNDGSLDRSEEIALNFISGDSRFSLIRQENQGLAVARNSGLDIAQGEYISFIDSDDWIDIDTFSTLDEHIDRSGADVVSFQFRKEPSGRVAVSSLASSEIRSVISGENLRDVVLRKGSGLIVSFCKKVYRRDMLESNHLRFIPELRKGQDGVLT